MKHKNIETHHWNHFKNILFFEKMTKIIIFQIVIFILFSVYSAKGAERPDRVKSKEIRQVSCQLCCRLHPAYVATVFWWFQQFWVRALLGHFPVNICLYFGIGYTELHMQISSELNVLDFQASDRIQLALYARLSLLWGIKTLMQHKMFWKTVIVLLFYWENPYKTHTNTWHLFYLKRTRSISRRRGHKHFQKWFLEFLKSLIKIHHNDFHEKLWCCIITRIHFCFYIFW